MTRNRWLGLFTFRLSLTILSILLLFFVTNACSQTGTEQPTANVGLDQVDQTPVAATPTEVSQPTEANTETPTTTQESQMATPTILPTNTIAPANVYQVVPLSVNAITAQNIGQIQLLAEYISDQSLNGMSFSTDGQILTVSVLYDEIDTFEIENFGPIQMFKMNHLIPVGHSPDGQNIFVYGAGSTHRLVFIEGDNVEEFPTVDFADDGYKCSPRGFSPDSRFLACRNDNHLDIWDIENKEIIHRVDSGPMALLWASDNSLLISTKEGKDDPTIWTFLDPLSGQVLVERPQDEVLIESVDYLAPWSPARRLSAVPSFDEAMNPKIHIYDFLHNQTINSIDIDDFALAMSWSPEGKLLAYVPFIEPTYMGIIDIESGEEIHRINLDLTQLVLIDWSPDGRYIALQSTAQNKIQLYGLP